jgi:hypothetical protein
MANSMCHGHYMFRHFKTKSRVNMTDCGSFFARLRL